MLRYPQGGTFTATGVTLKMLIMSAYEVQSFQVSGGPSWVGAERWDIQAKADGIPGRMPRNQFDDMLRALIEKRFQLKVRRESEEMPVYELVGRRTDQSSFRTLLTLQSLATRCALVMARSDFKRQVWPALRLNFRCS